jgi:hypothetical protein
VFQWTQEFFRHALFSLHRTVLPLAEPISHIYTGTLIRSSRLFGIEERSSAFQKARASSFFRFQQEGSASFKTKFQILVYTNLRYTRMSIHGTFRKTF